MKSYLLALVFLVISVPVFAAHPSTTCEKIDDYHIKVKVTKTHGNDNETVKTEREKIYTVAELNSTRAAHVAAKQSWVDSQSVSENQAEENIEIQDEEIEVYTSILEECQNLGIVEEPVEPPEEE